MKIVVIGGVTSTNLLIEKLFQYKFFNVHVLGYAPEDISRVSGWVDLSTSAKQAQYSFTPFTSVSDCRQLIEGLAPDLIFAVGLSQLIPVDILAIPKFGSIGFHPTALPRGRGRAPIAWLILESQAGAANFFFIRNGVDDGPVLESVDFSVTEEDDASSIEKKLLNAESLALDALLPRIARNDFSALEQDHSQASWYGRRTPDDGLINWQLSARRVLQLIRSSTTPHPGAFTYERDSTITIWRAAIEFRAEKGVVGRIIIVDADNTFVVQCGEGLLRVLEWTCSSSWLPRVGQLMGYYLESEVHRLRADISALTARVMKLESLLRQR
jgi:methionyl-tRNA formyltransferase